MRRSPEYSSSLLAIFASPVLIGLDSSSKYVRSAPRRSPRPNSRYIGRQTGSSPKFPIRNRVHAAHPPHAVREAYQPHPQQTPIARDAVAQASNRLDRGRDGQSVDFWIRPPIFSTGMQLMRVRLRLVHLLLCIECVQAVVAVWRAVDRSGADHSAAPQESWTCCGRSRAKAIHARPFSGLASVSPSQRTAQAPGESATVLLRKCIDQIIEERIRCCLGRKLRMHGPARREK